MEGLFFHEEKIRAVLKGEPFYSICIFFALNKSVFFGRHHGSQLKQSMRATEV